MTNNYELQKVSFSAAKLQNIENSISIAVLESKDAEAILIELIRIKKEIIAYVKKYYFETKEGNYQYYIVSIEDFEFRHQKSFKKEVSDKLGMDKAFKQCFKCNNEIFSVVCDIHQPRVYKEGDNYYINSCKGFLHKNYQFYSDYSPEIQSRAEMVLQMIKEISCNNDELLFDAYKTYISTFYHGKILEVIIYLKSSQTLAYARS